METNRVVKGNDFNFAELKTKNTISDCKYSKMGLADIYAHQEDASLNYCTLFLFYYNRIPNFIHEIGIDCEKANLWFANTFKDEIKDWYYNKRNFPNCNKVKYDDIFYMLDKDLLVDFDTTQSTVRFLFRETDITAVESIIDGIKKFKKRKERSKPEIALLVNTKLGIDTHLLRITTPKLNIEDNYNDDFKDIHQTILKRLSKNNDKGIVLLHGKPGTGKTSYIRYLITRLKKNVIFLPPNMAGAITNPELITVLISNPNSIFVIEDAENIVVDRNSDGHSPVSALLNISDGLLSDCLNIQIICSFNTDISKVDSALLRKGRLIAKYEFKELEVVKAQQLSNKLSFRTNIYKPMTLSEIYNFDEMNFLGTNQKRPIGFQTILNEAKQNHNL
jgi:hypothetical protein